VTAIAVGLTALGASAAGALRGVEPFASWFYVFAWYATLLVLDGAAALLGRERLSSLERPAHFVTLLAWSSVTWLFFELLNLRLRNWYYVFVPADPLARRAGVLLAFGTVFPAVFSAARVLDRAGLARTMRWPRLPVTRALLSGLNAGGVAALVLPLVWPDLFYPLVWVALTLLLEPANYRREPSRSLLGDLERGRPGRLLRLLAGGAAVGLLWELYNSAARSKWVYTVPGFEIGKLFEMPVAGFLGFPPFALECFAVLQALVLAGLAVPRQGPTRRRPARSVALAALAAALFSAAAVLGMERWTVSSLSPDLAELPGVPAADLQRAGYDAFSLAEARPRDVADAVARLSGESPRPSPEAAVSWIELARLAVLEGIGTANAARLAAVGVSSIRDLATADPEALAHRLSAGSRELEARRVRVWVQAAQHETDGSEHSVR
jgi:predicted flap endonuclease-1-like 5' DNA nuclease